MLFPVILLNMLSTRNVISGKVYVDYLAESSTLDVNLISPRLGGGLITCFIDKNF